MTNEDLKTILGKKGYGVASSLGKSSLRSEIGGKGSRADMEPCSGLQPIPEKGATLSYSGRCSISVKVYRRKLTDPLGDCTKYHVDSLRYAGLIRDDSDAEISITEEPHEKVETDAEERCEITLSYQHINQNEKSNMGSA